MYVCYKPENILKDISCVDLDKSEFFTFYCRKNKISFFDVTDSGYVIIYCFLKCTSHINLFALLHPNIFH